MKREVLTVRFDLNVAERLQQGKTTPESTIMLDVDLTELAEKDRGLLSRRMEPGSDNVFDVYRLQWDGTKEFRRPTLREGLADFYALRFPVRIEATEPTLEGLLEAVRADFERYKIR